MVWLIILVLFIIYALLLWDADRFDKRQKLNKYSETEEKEDRNG